MKEYRQLLYRVYLTIPSSANLSPPYGVDLNCAYLPTVVL